MAAMTRLYEVRVRGDSYLVDTHNPKRALRAVLDTLKADFSVELCSVRRAVELGAEGVEVMVVMGRTCTESGEE